MNAKLPSDLSGAALYRIIWRWHFYAGLFVIPFILLLSVTGGIYLFKPQIDHWEERSFRNLPITNAVSANNQLVSALAAYPGAQFQSYRLPVNVSDAALIHLGLADGRQMLDVYVSPQGKVVGAINPDSRITEWVRSIHGELLAGKWGSYLVELAGSWAIVMVISGLWLWWPKGRVLAGVLWPRLSLGSRTFWRDIHAVTGFWVSGLALVLLITALPWAGVWGSAFTAVRAEMGWVTEKADWKINSNDHAEHDHDAMMKMQAAAMPMTGLANIVDKAKAEKQLPYPILVKPPGMSDENGSSDMVWSVQTESQIQPLNVTITYDVATGAELTRRGFDKKHPLDRAVGYGIAWHEGQLFGWINQLIGLFTASALVTLAVSGFIMWRRRKPDNGIGAPILLATPARVRGLVAITFVLAAVLPLLAASLIMLWFFDRLILPRLPRLSVWLGFSPFQAE